MNPNHEYFTFAEKLDITHDILTDAVHRFDSQLTQGKLRDLGDLVTESKKLLELTPTQRRLLWEVVTMVDVDTLNDNLTRVGVGDADMDTAQDLDRLSDLLDPDSTFRDEWIALGAPMDGTGSSNT